MSEQDPNRKVFSVAGLTNPDTERPFGERYKGEFVVRRPTIQDKKDIAVREAAATSNFGTVDPTFLPETVRNTAYIFAFFSVIGEKVPKWFDASALYDDDMPAVTAAFKEVSAWLKDSF